MKVIKPGYRYQARYYNNPNRHTTLQFIEKAPNEQGTRLETVMDGTTNEELLKILIHRLEYQNELLQSWYTEQAAKHLELAVNFLNSRQEQRAAKGITNTMNK